jgi:hypothetical protein
MVGGDAMKEKQNLKTQHLKRGRISDIKLSEIHDKVFQTLISNNIIETNNPKAISHLIMLGLNKAYKEKDTDDFNDFITPLKTLVSYPNPYALYLIQYILEVIINDPNTIEVYGTDLEIYELIENALRQINDSDMMWQKEYEWLKWRWEFMRRNSEYRKDYQYVIELRKKAKYPPGSKIMKKVEKDGEFFEIPYDQYRDTPEYNKESEICSKYSLNEMLDPAESFEELIGIRGIFDKEKVSSSQRVLKWAIRVFKMHKIVGVLGEKAVKITGEYEKPDDEFWINEYVNKWNDTHTLKKTRSGYRYLNIRIDFHGVNSLANLKSSINASLDKFFNAFLEVKKKRGHEKRQLYKKADYRRLLIVGDMKEKDHKTNPEIAKKLFPYAFDSNNEEEYNGLAVERQESAIKKVDLYYQRYKHLVNYGYKTITFP